MQTRFPDTSIRYVQLLHAGSQWGGNYPSAAPVFVLLGTSQLR